MNLSDRRISPALALCLLVVASAASHAQPVADGDRLTDRQRRTLYVFDNDVAGSGRSACQGACNNVFTPYLVEDGAAVADPLGTARRDDGTVQWTYKGRPLYRFYADDKPPDRLGDGINRGLWHVATP